MFVLEIADYVLMGSRSKLQTVVKLTEGLSKREREQWRESDIVLLLIEDEFKLHGGVGKRGVDSCQSTLNSP